MKSRPCVYGEMLSFRVSSDERIELSKLANRRRMPVSVLLRSLIQQAATAQQAQKATKSAPSGAALSTNASAAK